MYILDDVLSALDTVRARARAKRDGAPAVTVTAPHRHRHRRRRRRRAQEVGRHVFQHVLSNVEGFLRSKTRVLVTHAAWVLPLMDAVVVIRGGRIASHGPFQAVAADAVDVTVDVAAAVAASNSAPERMQASATASMLAERSRGDQVKKETALGGEVRGGALGLYVSYIRAGGGGVLFGGVGMLFVVSQAVRVFCDYWVALWCGAAYNGWSNVDYVIGLGVCVGTFVVLGVLRSMAFSSFMLRSSTALHDSMFAKVIVLPMSYFWTTLTGRVLNRFSKVRCAPRSVPPQPH